MSAQLTFARPLQDRLFSCFPKSRLASEEGYRWEDG